MVYAVVMTIIYPLGVPALYAYMLFWRYRSELRELQRRAN